MAVIRPLLAVLACLTALGPLGPAAQEAEPAPRPVVWYVRFEALEGRDAEARDRCRRTLQYLKANYPGTQGGVYATWLIDRPTALHRFVETPDMETMYRVWRAEETDEGFKPLVEGLRASTNGVMDTVWIPTGPSSETAAPSRVLRTARARFGRMPEALRVAEELGAHMSAYEGLSVRTFVQDSGDLLTVHWVIDFASLDVWYDATLELLRDPEYEAILKRAGEVFLEESTTDTLMEDRIG